MFALQEPRAVIQIIILAVPLKIGGSSLWMNWLLVTCVFLCPLDQQGAMLGIPLVQSPSYSIVHGLDLTPAPRMPVSTQDFLAFWVGSRNPISCYCYPGWAVVLSHVKKSSEHILKSFRFRWCFVLPRSLSTFGSRRNGWSCQLLRSKWLHLRQLNFKNTGTRNCVSNNFWAEKKAETWTEWPEKSNATSYLRILLPSFDLAVFTAIWCEIFLQLSRLAIDVEGRHIDRIPLQ